MLLVDYAVGLLNFSHIYDNRLQVGVANPRSWRHVAKIPVVPHDSEVRRVEERLVGVMTWVVDRMNKGRPFVGPSSVSAMALRTVGVESGFANARFGRENRWNEHCGTVDLWLALRCEELQTYCDAADDRADREEF